MNGPDLDALMIEIKDLRIASERSADALDQLVDLVRSLVRQGGEVGPLGPSSDVELAAAIYRTAGADSFTVSSLSEAAELRSGEQLREALHVAFAGAADPRRIGAWLRRQEQDPSNLPGFRVRRVGVDHNAVCWRIEEGS